jgi:hypothetical protein
MEQYPLCLTSSTCGGCATVAQGKMARAEGEAMRVVRLGLVAATLLWIAPAAAQDASQCFTLAGEAAATRDGQAILAALTACQAAVAQSPGDPQTLNAYALTLELSGDVTGATRLYQWSAAAGYPAAAEALARIANGGAMVTSTDTVAGVTDTSTPAAPPSPEATAVVDRLSAFSALLETARAGLPRTTFDPASVVDEVGTDPDALTTWVASQTTLLPYAGRLRGPVGVLMDRHGNSLDRALLLQALLAAAGHDAVLAHGAIAPKMATRLLVDRTVAPEVPAAAPDSPDVVLASLGIDPADDPLGIGAQVAADTAASEKERAALADAVERQSAALLAMLPAASGTTESPAEAAAPLRDHWWVRLIDGGMPRDLDPDQAAATVTNVEEVAPEALAPELSQSVTVTVVAEYLEQDGTLREAPILTHALLPADLAGTAVTLWHQPLNMPEPDKIVAAADPMAAFEGGALAETAWQPVIQVGTDVFPDRIMTTTGATPEGDEAGIQAARDPMATLGGEGAGGTAFDVMGTLDIGGDEPAAPVEAVPAAELVAEWLEFAITKPDGTVMTDRRAIFDLIGAAARDAGSVAITMTDAMRRERTEALLQQIDIAAWGATPSGAFAADVVVRDSIALTRTLMDAFQGATDVASLPETFSRLPRSQLMTLAFATGRWVDGGGVDGGGALDHPNVVLIRRGYRLDGTDTPTQFTLFDIVENGVAPASAADAFAQNVRQGVADTQLEYQLLGSPEDSRNTAALFGKDLAAGRPWTLLATADDPGLLALPADDRARIEAAIAQGAAVVAPTGLVADEHLVWWRIDPITGRTLGIGINGAGATMAEYANVVTSIIGWVSCAAGLASAVKSGAIGGGIQNSSFGATAGLALCFIGVTVNAFASYQILNGAAAYGGLQAASGVVGAAGGLVTGLDSLIP